jgi:hypothetical protein
VSHCDDDVRQTTLASATASIGHCAASPGQVYSYAHRKQQQKKESCQNENNNCSNLFDITKTTGSSTNSRRASKHIDRTCWRVSTTTTMMMMMMMSIQTTTTTYEQTSAISQVPAAARHDTPALTNESGGHVADDPVHYDKSRFNNCFSMAKNQQILSPVRQNRIDLLVLDKRSTML